MQNNIILKLKSNVVLKSMYDKRPKDYVPIELLGQVDRKYIRFHFHSNPRSTY